MTPSLDHNTWVTTLLWAKQMKSLESNETITSSQLKIVVIYMWEITCSLHNNFQLSEIVSGVWEMRNFKIVWLFGILFNNCYSSIGQVNCDCYSSSVVMSLVWDDRTLILATTVGIKMVNHSKSQMMTMVKNMYYVLQSCICFFLL